MPRLFRRRRNNNPEPEHEEPNWNVNPGYQDQGVMNPLFDPGAVVEEEQQPVLNAFAQRADHKQRTTGKGHGKKVMKDRHVGVEGGGTVNASANKVGSKTYNRNIGDSGTNVGYFKSDDSNKISQEALGVGIGTDDNDQHMGARAVASSRLDKKLGINVLSHDHFAKHGDHRGVVSAQAKGDALMENIYADMPEQQAEAYLQMLQSGDMTEEEIENFGNKVKHDDDGMANGISVLDHPEYNTDVDLTNENTLKGLSDLQVMDYLTGQVDRHAGNIHIDTDSGQVTGIDNDLAFGTDNDGLDESQNFMGLPQFIDRMTANAVAEMTERDFLKTISGSRKDYGRLSEDEKNAALERFRTLKDHIDNLRELDPETGEDQLIDVWDESVLDEATAAMKEDDGEWRDMDGFQLKAATTSYIARAAFDLKE